MYCKTCYTNKRYYELRFEKVRDNLWIAHCTNPNHAHSFYCSYQFINGGWFLRPQRMKKQKHVSQVLGDTVYYWDGQKEQKIKKSYLEHIRSRAVTKEGEVLTGKKGLKYNRERGGTGYKSDVIMG